MTLDASGIGNNSFFTTLKRHILHESGLDVDIAVKLNPLNPFKSSLGESDPDFKTDEDSSYYGYYPPATVLFSLEDPRSIEFLANNYQGIKTVKAKLLLFYFQLLQQSRMNKLLLPAIVRFTPASGFAEEIRNILGDIVLGGLGSKVKIFNLDRECVTNLLKEGYPQDFLENEITVREKNQDILPIPKLLGHSADRQSYIEEYKMAIPVNELNDVTWPMIHLLFEKLFILYGRHLVKAKPTDKYFDTHLATLKNKVDNLPVLLNSKIFEIIGWLEKLRQRLRKSTTYSVHAHGDFWLGNILCESSDPTVFEWENKNLILVDWERTDRLSLFHDFFTIFGMHALENEDYTKIKDILSLSENTSEVRQILQLYSQSFNLQIDYHYLLGQLTIFLLERFLFTILLYEDISPAQDDLSFELEKWYRFFKSLITKNILPDVI